jgi:hypothetical protein
MTLRKAFLVTWLSSFVLFAIVLFLHMPLVLTEVPGGIVDHQTAGSAAEVNRIHAAWEAAGVIGTARYAVISDLIWIGVFGLGSVLGGQYFRTVGSGVVRHLGTLIILCGVVFIISDYGETFAQFRQLIAYEGSDAQAGLAATLQPIKMVASNGALIGVIVCFAIRWFQQRAA